jgi:hypothetical protein
MHLGRLAPVAALLAVLLAACGGGGQGPRGDGGDGGPSAPLLPAIIPRTTKVADADTRAALTAFEADGTLRFSRSTAVLSALAAGDVIVSEPAAAARHGFLRRVVAVDRSGGTVVVSTTGATLTDAIDQGELRAVRELTPAMLSASDPIIWPMAPGAPGLRGAQGPPAVWRPPLLLAADGDYPFFVRIDASLGDNIKAQGFLGFGLSVDFQVRIGAKWLPPFVKVEHVRAGLGIRQKGSLSLVAGAGVRVGSQVTVAIWPFTPIVFAIGPVPVVITPVLKIQVGAKGEVMASLTYSVAEELPIAAGLDYNPDDGWRSYSSGSPVYESNSVAAKVSAAVEVSAGARGELLLYGLAGGFAEINGFLKLDAQVPRYPIWRLSGGVDAFVGVSLDLIAARYESRENIARRDFPIAQAPNAPPSLRIAGPAAGTTVDSAALGGTPLVAEVSDLEDGAACCAVTWSDDRGETIPAGKEVTASFSTPGTHLLTATAVDALGAMASATVSINVAKRPPTAAILKPAAMQAGLAVGVPTALQGQGMDGPGMLPCDRLRWTSSVPGDTFSDGATGCLLTATFASEGPRRLTLTATDAFGMSGTAFVDVTVGPRPATPVVSAFIREPIDGGELRFDLEYTLRGDASDTADRVFRDFVWRATGCGIDQVIGTTAGGTTGSPPFVFTVKTSTLKWRPSASGFSACPAVVLTLTVTPADGTEPGLAKATVSLYRLQ